MVGKKIKVEEFTKQVRFFFECKECGTTDFVEDKSLDDVIGVECDNCGEFHLIERK